MKKRAEIKKELGNFLRFIEKNRIYDKEIYLGARPTRDKTTCSESVLYLLPVSLIEKIKSKKQKGMCYEDCKIHYLFDRPYYLDYVLVKKK